METTCLHPHCERAAEVKGKCRTCYANDRQKAKRAAAKPTLICEHCGEQYKPQRYYKSDGGTKRNRFCSRKCKEKAWHRSGGSSFATRKSLLKRKYGITYDDYQRMLVEQAGACAICGTTTPVGRRAENRSMWLHVDHCHDTGKVRGLLCHHCNLGMGNFKHDPSLFVAALEYLAVTS